jgi:hypothetical protein
MWSYFTFHHLTSLAVSSLFIILFSFFFYFNIFLNKNIFWKSTFITILNTPEWIKRREFRDIVILVFFNVCFLVLWLKWFFLCNFFFSSMSCLCSGLRLIILYNWWTGFKLWFWSLLDVIWFFRRFFVFICHWINIKRSWFGMLHRYLINTWKIIKLNLIYNKLS